MIISSSRTRVTLGSSGVFLAGSCFLFYEIYSDFMNIDSFLLSKKSWDWFFVDIFYHNFSKLVLHGLFLRRAGMSQLQLYVGEQISGLKLGTVLEEEHY